MKRISVYMAVFSLAMFAATAQANLLDDGSLEAGTDGTQDTNSAWTLTNNQGDPNSVGAGVFSASAWAAKDGAQGLWFQSFNGSADPNAGNCGGGPCDLNLNQTGIVAPSNGLYTLTFWSARETNHLATSDIVSLRNLTAVTSASIDLFTATYNDTLNMIDGGGTRFTLSVAASAGDVLEVDADLVGGISNPGASESLMLDHFTLSVPEPTSVALAGLGLLGAFAMRRRH